MEPLIEEVHLYAYEMTVAPPRWVVVGAENGPKRRPMDHAWARTIIEQCHASQVPVWFKGWHEPPVWAGPVPRETPWTKT